MKKQNKTELEISNAQITMYHSRVHANALVRELNRDVNACVPTT